MPDLAELLSKAEVVREEVEERMEVEGAAPDKALAAARVAVDSCAAVESAPVATGVEDGGAPGRGLAAYLHQEHGRAVAATLGWNMVRLETQCCCCCRPTTAQRYSCLPKIALQCCSMNAGGIFNGSTVAANQLSGGYSLQNLLHRTCCCLKQAA